MSYLHPEDQSVVGAIPQDLRHAIIEDIYTDLLAFGAEQGYSSGVTRGAVEAFFRTFALQVFTYLLIGSRDLAGAVEDNVTINWLDLTAGAKTVRERIIERLS